MLPVAKVSKLFGSDGQLAVNLYDTFPGEINKKEPLYVIIDMLAVPLFVENFKRKGRSGAVITFSDLDTPKRASELIGLELLLPSVGTGPRLSGDGDVLEGSPAIKGQYEEGIPADASVDVSKLSVQDLVGFRVVMVEEPDLYSEEAGNPDAAGNTVSVEGRIVDFIENGGNPLFEIETADTTLYIPAVGDYIVAINGPGLCVHFELPSGLLDLN